jgi:hypothetical protein
MFKTGGGRGMDEIEIFTIMNGKFQKQEKCRASHKVHH